MFRAILPAALLAIASMANAQSNLAQDLKTVAQTQSGPISAGLEALTYNDALYLLDELNHTDLRLLSDAAFEGKIDLPRSIRQAMEVKAPRLNRRGAGR